ncbi:MAG: hypothetical protein SOW30_03645 [Parabacteroides sp.]|nr:hypothetical protein [Parabacteroides sp.]
MGYYNKQRLDLSEWIIHFVHDRQPVDDPSTLADIAIMEGYTGDMRLPDYYDKDGEPHNILTTLEENEYPIDDDAPALDILNKILHDGYIKSGWSLRNFTPTIYGPASAVCFTEMPLYALVDYAKTRRKSGYVGNYGIAFRRRELFAAGARNVIYGLSTNHLEAETDERGIFQGRLLDIKATGIGIQEQYRYVATNLTKETKSNEKLIDWTHEREWRWALPYDSLGVPGLPFFLSKEYADFFTDIIIIVPSDEEMEIVLKHLKTLYDAGHTNTGREYDKNKIAAARVLSLEGITHFSDISQLKIDDLPIKQMKVIPNFVVTRELDNKVREAALEASKKATEAIKVFLLTHPDFDENKGEWGWAYVCTQNISETTEALQNAGLSKTYSDGIYRLNLVDYKTSNLVLLEVGAEAAAKYLTNELRQPFFVTTQLD